MKKKYDKSKFHRYTANPNPVSQFSQGKTCFHYMFSLQGSSFITYRDFPTKPCTSLYGIAVHKKVSKATLWDFKWEKRNLRWLLIVNHGWPLHLFISEGTQLTNYLLYMDPNRAWQDLGLTQISGPFEQIPRLVSRWLNKLCGHCHKPFGTRCNCKHVCCQPKMN